MKILIRVIEHIFWKDKKKFEFAEDSNPHWVMYLITQGSCYYQINRDNGLAKAGDILICPPHGLFKRQVSSPITFHFIVFFTEETSSFPTLISTTNSPYFSRYAQNLHFLDAPHDPDIYQNFAYETHLIEDTLMVFNWENTLGEPHQQNEDSFLRQAIHLLADFKHFDLSLEQIATSLHVTSSHFSRKFKAKTATTPIKYRNHIKLNLAKKLLLEKDQSIEAIAFQCGFHDVFYFSRFFKRQTGVSPSVYRHHPPFRP